MISRNSLIYTVSFVRWWYPAVYLFHFNEFCSMYLLKHLPPLSPSFSSGWTWTNCSSIHQKLHSLLLAQNNNVSNLLTSQTRISAMIPSQSISLLAILVPPVSVTCISLIKSTLYLNRVIFTIVEIRRIRHLFPPSVATALANSLVSSSKLDYCNSLYFVISQAKQI